MCVLTRGGRRSDGVKAAIRLGPHHRFHEGQTIGCSWPPLAFAPCLSGSAQLCCVSERMPPPPMDREGGCNTEPRNVRVRGGESVSGRAVPVQQTPKISKSNTAAVFFFSPPSRPYFH